MLKWTLPEQIANILIEMSENFCFGYNPDTARPNIK